MKKLLPVVLNVEGRRVLIVGGGVVGTYKAGLLQECGAEITIISPEVLCTLPDVHYEIRAYEPGDEAGFDIVFAATGHNELNRQITIAARAAGALVNDTSDARSSDFHNAAIVRRQDIAIGITTGRVSPTLAKHIREQIEAAVGPEYETLLEMAAAAQIGLKQRGDFWRRILASNVLDLIRAGKHNEAQEQLMQIRKELAEAPDK